MNADDETLPTNFLQSHWSPEGFPTDSGRPADWLLKKSLGLHESAGGYPSFHTQSPWVPAPLTDKAPTPEASLPMLTDQIWETRFEELVAFREAHGHCRVPSKWKANQPLAYWVKRQRERHAEGGMKEPRVRRLEEIGFVWMPAGVRAEELWQQRVAALEAFYAEHGHLRVSKHDLRWPGLASWLSDQRTSQRRGGLASERQAKLEELGIDWEPTQMTASKTGASSPIGLPSSSVVPLAGEGPPTNEIGRWEYFYLQLLAFNREQGHVNVPADWPLNPALAAWVQEQRPGREYGRLHFDQIARLEKLRFEWTAEPNDE